MSLKISMTPTRSENLVTFGLDRDLIPPGTGLSFASAAQADSHPLARALFQVRGVKSVWILGRDIQAGKDPRALGEHHRPGHRSDSRKRSQPVKPQVL